MEQFSQDALERFSKAGKRSRLASKNDPRFRHGTIFPELAPTFSLTPGETIFTIGSCFARSIETRLTEFVLPTKKFQAPEDEWPHRPNGLLNEYNVGTISQRILYAIERRSFGDEAIASNGEEYHDLLLPTLKPVSKSRLLERRAEIEEIYLALPRSDVVILTLGLIEAWKDTESGLFLNRMPPHPRSQRYRHHIMEVEEAYYLLEHAIGASIDSGIRRVIITVSPIPCRTTFSGQDCFIANGYSKAALRVCADKLARRFPQVNYFPSFEIVGLCGSSAFQEDNCHIEDALVEDIMNHMLKAYLRPG